MAQPVPSAEPRRVIAEAKAAQGRFERGRRQWLPVTGGGGGRCDARIGRFCYWYDDGDTTLPREPEAIRRDRARLIATLETAHAALPDDDWLWGQRVRYLIDAERADSAADIAARCRGTAWWCDAIRGLALHVAERFGAADSAFAAALAGMPEATRCRWTDWRSVIRDRRLLSDESDDCPGRAARMDTLWWLAKPLLASPGNDLRTELYSRRVMAEIQSSAVPPHLLAWGRDLEELMLRYGWSKRWSVASYSSLSGEPPSLIGHDRPPAYWFFPFPGDSATPWRWELAPNLPQSRHAPSYADRFEATDDATLAVFPRADSTIVVAAFGPAAAARFTGPGSELALTGSPAPDIAATARPRGGGAGAPVLLRMAGRPVLIGLEARSDSGRRFLVFRRYRAPLPDSGALRLSDPLLFRVDSVLPATVEEAAARLVPGRRISRQTPIGVYWEWSGAAGDSIDVTIAMVPARRGLFGRMALGLSLASRRLPLTLQWQAGAAGATADGRAIELDLGRLAPGQYRLELGASSARGRAAATLPVELVP